MSTAGARHVKALEKVFLGISSSCDEKLQQLESEFRDHQDWLAKTITDTRESKDALGLVCPPTTRKAIKTAGRFAQEEDKENVSNNGNTSKQNRNGKRSNRTTQEPEENSLAVFDPEGETEPAEQPPAKHAKPSVTKTKELKPESKPEPKASAANDTVSSVPGKKELSKLKVVDLRAELQKKGLSSTGLKDDLVSRLAAAYEVEASMNLPPVFVGKDVMPTLGMRVRHANGQDHGSSRGMGGTIEIIPGRDARSVDEKSASVRWDADTSDIRGPYYTGEPCDRGSGIGTSKYDLICIDPLPSFPEGEESVAPDTPLQPAQTVAADEVMTDARVEEPAAEAMQDEPEAAHEEEPAAAAVEEEEAMEPEEEQEEDEEENAKFEEVEAEEPEAEAEQGPAVEEKQEAPPKIISYVSGLQEDDTPRAAGSGESESTQRLSGGKRSADGSIKRPSREPTTDAPPAPKEAWAPATQPAAPTSSSSAASAAPAPSADAGLFTPVKSSIPRVASADSHSKPLAGPRGAVESLVSGEAAEKRRAMQDGTPVKMEPRVELCSSAKKAQKPPDVGQVHDSVQQFRAIISRINADKDIREASGAPPSASRLPPRSNSISLARPVATGGGATGAVAAAREELEGSAKKPSTWPPPAQKVLARPLDSAGKHTFGQSGAEAGSNGLTSEALLAHTQQVGKHDMLGAFKHTTTGRQSNTSAGVKEEASRGTVAREASRLDASQRQQRAAENRAKLEEEVKRKAAEQERKRKELEGKRIEAERIAGERRQKEMALQAERLEAAKRRAAEEEERRIAKLKEEEDRKRQERDQAERERKAHEERERERQAKLQQQQAAAAAGGGGLFGAIGGAVQKVVGGVWGSGAPAEQQAEKHSTGSADSGPTTIQIIEQKNSDDSSDEDEGKKKQIIPTWARSPHLRRQLERQLDQSPTPVFGECKKTCDLAAMFVNHQPKRRRYDKRTSSADWGDDSRASFMEEERFQRKVMQSMQQSSLNGKGGR